MSAKRESRGAVDLKRRPGYQRRPGYRLRLNPGYELT